MKLDLGGIGRHQGRGGWYSVNIASKNEWGGDYSLDILSPEFDRTFPDHTIEAMLCSHTIEHLPCNKTREALNLWHRKLIPGGLMEIICPDGLDIVQRFARGEVAWLTVMNVLYGVPEWLDDNPYNQHLYAFSFETLMELMESCNYKFVANKLRSWEHNYANEKDQPYFGKFRINDLHVIFKAI